MNVIKAIRLICMSVILYCYNIVFVNSGRRLSKSRANIAQCPDGNFSPLVDSKLLYICCLLPLFSL